MGTVVAFGRLKCSVCLSLGGSSTVFQLDKIMVVVVMMMMMMMMSNFVSGFFFSSFSSFFSALSSNKLALNWSGSKFFKLLKAEAICATRRESEAVLN